MKTKTESVRGRPSKLTPDKLETALLLRDKGFSIEEIASALKVSEALFYMKNTEWEKLRLNLNAMKAAQDAERVRKIEKSLFERAKGYKTKERKDNYDKNGDLLGYTITTKEVPADVKAQTLLLTNLAPDRWRTQPTESDGGENKKDTNIKIEIVGD